MSIPSFAGSYALHLVLPEPLLALQVGRLGRFDFPAGDYIYLGSACGPGGLHARLAHHARLAARPHWHIDFLRAQAQLRGAWFTCSTERIECLWSTSLLNLPAASLPAAHFGSSDCQLGCAAHLVCVPAELAAPVLHASTDNLVWHAFSAD